MSLSFNQDEKLNIFNYAKNNSRRVKYLIKIFSDEQKWLDFIKKDYQKNINQIWDKFKNYIENKIEDNNILEQTSIRNKIKSLKEIELDEKNDDLEQISNLINKI